MVSLHVSIHNSQAKSCLQQLDITKRGLIKSKQFLQINISFSICVIQVELIDDQRIATSSQILCIALLSRLLFMPVTIVNWSSKSECNLLLSMPTRSLMSIKFGNKYNTYFHMQCYKNCSMQKLLFSRRLRFVNCFNILVCLEK